MGHCLLRQTASLQLEAVFNLLKHYSISACASLYLLRCTGYSRAFRDFMQDWNLLLKQDATSSRGQRAIHTIMPWIQLCMDKVRKYRHQTAAYQPMFFHSYTKHNFLYQFNNHRILSCKKQYAESFKIHSKTF